MKLIVVTGMPGAGKEEFLNIAVKRNIPFIRMGDLVREAHAERSEADSDLNIGQFATMERERYGYNIWAKRALKRMSGNLFLVDGCRSMDEVLAYRGLTDDVDVVAIHSSPCTRYQRLISRARDDAPKDLDEFKARDSREMGWGLSELIALSDAMIVNDGSLEDFETNVNKFLDKVLEK